MLITVLILRVLYNRFIPNKLHIYEGKKALIPVSAIVFSHLQGISLL
jgi:hypothetical protein